MMVRYILNKANLTIKIEIPDSSYSLMTIFIIEQ